MSYTLILHNLNTCTIWLLLVEVPNGFGIAIRYNIDVPQVKA